MELNDVLLCLNFRMEHKTENYTRYRYSGAPDNPDWALIAYCDDEPNAVISRASAQLIKYGRWQKIQEITTY